MPDEKVIVTVNFSKSAYDVLKELAKRNGNPVAETLRDAIAMLKYVMDAWSDGKRILVEDKGNIKELLPRRRM